ncbi:hypothetical protein AMJ80_08740 [bacterium SM23_31]|nr:MAG: hypothetical protein AMJ80_08740 [bacterium SM23_31]
MRHISFKLLILYVILGALIGSLLGEIARLLPSGVVKDFFLRSVTAGFDPATLNLKIITFTVGFTFTLNIAGVLGVAIAVYMLRWYR